MKITRRTFLGGIAASLVTSCVSTNISLPILNSQKSKLKIAFLTDLHLQNSFEKQEQISQTCERALKAIKNQSADLIIGGGDWIHRGALIPYETAQRDLRKLNNLWQELPGAKLLIPGNHDFTRSSKEITPNLDLFYQEIPSALKTNSEIDLGSAVLFSFNTISFSPNKEYEYSGRISEATLVWLAQRLASYPSDTPKIILSHIPFMTTLSAHCGEPAQKSWTVENGLELFKLLGEQNSTIILQGHLHINEFIQWNNTYSIIGGALCGKWWDGDFHGTKKGFGVLKLEGNQADWEYVNV